jgi:hypothetical protein
MGIFFRSSPPTTQTIHLDTALNPHAIIHEQMSAELVPEPPPPPGDNSFMWGRLIFAVVLLAAVFAAGIYCAHDDKLAEWGKILLHSFELLLGALIGLITGEAAHK